MLVGDRKGPVTEKARQLRGCRAFAMPTLLRRTAGRNQDGAPMVFVQPT